MLGDGIGRFEDHVRLTQGGAPVLDRCILMRLEQLVASDTRRSQPQLSQGSLQVLTPYRCSVIQTPDSALNNKVPTIAATTYGSLPKMTNAAGKRTRETRKRPLRPGVF